MIHYKVYLLWMYLVYVQAMWHLFIFKNHIQIHELPYCDSYLITGIKDLKRWYIYTPIKKKNVVVVFFIEKEKETHKDLHKNAEYTEVNRRCRTWRRLLDELVNKNQNRCDWSSSKSRERRRVPHRVECVACGSSYRPRLETPKALEWSRVVV